MHRLVCSGVSRPGQTSWALLDSMALDTLLHFAYGELVKGAEPKEKEKVDNTLASLDVDYARDDRMLRKTLDDGTVVSISEARLARLRANIAGMAAMKKGR